MSSLNQSRFAARIEFLMLHFQATAIVLTSMALLSPLALLPFIGRPVTSAIIASSTIALTYFAQRQIAKRLFKGPPASEALISQAREALPFACRATFNQQLHSELQSWRQPLSAWRVVELHRSIRRQWQNAIDLDEGLRDRHIAAQHAEVRD